MSVITEAEKLALSLPERDRAKLAERLLISLRPVLDAEDGGIAEARRRSGELERDPEMGISLEELDRRMKDRFR